MPEYATLRGLPLTGLLLLSGCALTPPAENCPTPAVPPISSVEKQPASEPAKPRDNEKRLADRLRLCNEERHRLEAALQESQKRSDDLQKKINALLMIDREVRNREKEKGR